jgi:hypothetical protein
MVRFYKNKAGEYRWQIKGGNGEIVSASSEGFASKQGAVNNLLMTHSMIGTMLARIAKGEDEIQWEDESEGD